MKKKGQIIASEYNSLLKGVSRLLESARQTSARSVNAIMTMTYWNVGKQISNSMRHGNKRAEYGKEVISQLAADLTVKYGRGFSKRNLHSMLKFYQLWSDIERVETPVKSSSKSAKLSASQIVQTPSAQSAKASIPFPLPWSHYVRLMAVRKLEAREFYEQESLRGGWSIRQLERQIGSLFYERTLLSKKKGSMLKKGQKKATGDVVLPEEEIKDPYVLEFLDLKDEYSENDIEAGLISRLEAFLLELGSDFAFVGKQKRLRIDDEWFRVDLLFFHRRLKCLVIIDLKLDKLTHADIGQMHLYLNYARENWTHKDENPPVGLILCASKGQTLARYALAGLPNKVLASEYKMMLPDEEILVAKLDESRKRFERRRR